MAVDTTTVSEAFAALRSGNDIGGRHQLAALDTLCELLDRAQSDDECAALGDTARRVSGIESLGRLLPSAAARARAQPTDGAGCLEDRLQFLRRCLFVLSNLCSQAVDPRCGAMRVLTCSQPCRSCFVPAIRTPASCVPASCLPAAAAQVRTRNTQMEAQGGMPRKGATVSACLPRACHVPAYPRTMAPQARRSSCSPAAKEWTPPSARAWAWRTRAWCAS